MGSRSGALTGSVSRVTSPAERFAAARKRAEESKTPLSRFRGKYPFDLDGFQLDACEALAGGRGVLVAAPTGSGKTVVGEFAVFLAMDSGRKAFYTTPIKALSNQKYADLARMHGAENVGLLTGDTAINADAPVVVMTTEVLRNMLYADSPALHGLAYVVMDEVHYLADRFRGAVWEEVIIHLPDDVLLVSLSATVSNAEEFGAWLDTVRGNTEVVVSEDRPVPLWQHVMANRQLYDLFAESSSTDNLNPELLQITRDANRRERQFQGVGGRRGGTTAARGAKSRSTYTRGGPRRPSATPSRVEVINALDSAGLLPAISFIFSRAGCDAAVQQCLYSGLRLTSPEERTEIRHVVESRTADIPDEDLAVLGYYEWAEALSRGVAAHHAGLLPAFKEVVEELFTRGLVKAVFATETLALGINMPARSVVLEKLVKWNGETHADITPGEYTQLTGRAGRRGIDVEGHAVVLWQPGLDPEVVGGLASTRTFPLRSSFRPTYNMAVNLVGQVGRARAREILETSFAQFQADRAVVGLAKQARKQEEALEGYAEAMNCHLGDFREYASLRRKIGERETHLSRSASRDRRSDVIGSLERLRRGDVIRVPGGRKPGWAVVLDPGVGGGDSLEGPRPSILSIERQVRRLSLMDVPTPVEATTRITVPKNFNGRDATARRDLASSVRNALGALRHDDDVTKRRPKGKKSAVDEDEELNRLRRQLRSHPCHGCAEREDHARWSERYFRLRRETDALVRRIEGRTNTIARVFDRVCDLLTERGYLAGDKVTPAGEQLRRIYSESDLLVSECLRKGVWKDLDMPGLAAVVSAAVYQSRRDEKGLSPRIPQGGPTLALDTMTRIWSVLDDEERAHKLDVTPEPDLGLAWAIHRWAGGQPLQAVLRDADLAAGDFVRWCKQVIDLLGQIAQASDDPALVRTARSAVEAISRGVVASGPTRA
ncbi:DEAD/DEAH box helicase [Kineosporia mesophila]|uniref:DEAD/DEAH box helicase n=1 Tax=Kineosporia mesophila TaxID=566012 RepID=A0ABP6ZLU3_9ACTN|nr:DEAD/DEAH box helicase [Kineosporia mesophila]